MNWIPIVLCVVLFSLLLWLPAYIDYMSNDNQKSTNKEQRHLNGTDKETKDLKRNNTLFTKKRNLFEIDKDIFELQLDLHRLKDENKRIWEQLAQTTSVIEFYISHPIGYSIIKGVDGLYIKFIKEFKDPTIHDIMLVPLSDNSSDSATIDKNGLIKLHEFGSDKIRTFKLDIENERLIEIVERKARKTKSNPNASGVKVTQNKSNLKKSKKEDRIC